MNCFRLILVVALAAGCNKPAMPVAAKRLARDKHGATSTREPASLSREAILRHMPTNSDKRCVGIAVVTEALLDGIAMEESGCEEVETIAERVYASLVAEQRLRYPRQVMLAGTRVPIDSKAAIDRLSTLVSELYEQDYNRLLTSEAGQQKLMSAHYSFIATSEELDRLLDADPDGTAAFFGTGTRVFPDGAIEETSHAFLLGKLPSGQTVVYDPNDPGKPITCQVLNTEEGAVVEWTCRYRETGHTTTQSYLVVDRETAFGTMLGA